MEPRRHPANVLDLSNELLCDILERIEADPDKLVSLDRRAYLSVESFSQPPRQLPNSQQTIGSFRLACRRFSELGVMYQLPRVTTRFSQRGLSRLERIAGQPHLARHVKKFSYMVPYFYVEGKLLMSLQEDFALAAHSTFVMRTNIHLQDEKEFAK